MKFNASAPQCCNASWSSTSAVSTKIPREQTVAMAASVNPRRSNKGWATSTLLGAYVEPELLVVIWGTINRQIGSILAGARSHQFSVGRSA